VKYEALARELAESIRKGVLVPGARLPSVRQASANRGVSPATVFEAYYLLEAQGLIHSRPKSGYYVSTKLRIALPEPDRASLPDGESRPVEISERVFELIESAMSHDVVPLGSAFPSPLLFPLEKLGRAMATSAMALDPWSTVDDLTPGNEGLRRQIALRYLIDGLQVGIEDIVVTNGALEALNLCLSAVCRPGDAVVVESPCFYACLQALERHGLHAIEVSTDPREGIDLFALESAIQRHRPKACWLMTNFQNPLGSTMGAEKKKALVELVTRFEVALIEDDVYAELYFGEQRPVPAKAFDRDGWVMHCSSFSKTLAPGYRIGWVAPGRFRKLVARHKLMATLATCIPAQMAIARYLERGIYDRYLRQLRKTLAANRDQFSAAIGARFPAGSRVSRPMGGYFLWIELPQGTDAMAVQGAAIKAGISVASGPIFSAMRGFTNCLRLNYGHAFDERTESALMVLGELCGAKRSK
jgi:DNA-binding transcriptional MocR family regulator